MLGNYILQVASNYGTCGNFGRAPSDFGGMVSVDQDTIALKLLQKKHSQFSWLMKMEVMIFETPVYSRTLIASQRLQ